MHESEKWKWSHSVMSDSSVPMDCSLPGSSIHGIFQARVLEWGATAFSEPYVWSGLILFFPFFNENGETELDFTWACWWWWRHSWTGGPSLLPASFLPFPTSSSQSKPQGKKTCTAWAQFPHASVWFFPCTQSPWNIFFFLRGQCFSLELKLSHEMFCSYLFEETLTLILFTVTIL